MKKIAIGILSVFMILGGLLLSACDNKVSLSVSETEVTLYTNYESEPSSRQIQVSVGNSSAGINIDVLSGEGVIKLSTVTERGSGNYSFEISTTADKQSGDAQIRVSARDDYRQNQIIDIHVNTVLEDIEVASDDTTDARTNLFVVKGVEKALDVDTYFNLKPLTANVRDIVWSFEDTESENPQEFVRDDVLYATIENNVLRVNDEFGDSYITLRASFVNDTSISNVVEFEVLNRSTINNLTVDGIALYQNDAVSTTEATFDLVRNNANLSSVDGSIIINTPYSINLTPVVSELLPNGSLHQLSREEYENFLSFDIGTPVIDDAAGRITYNFSIDALDQTRVNQFATLYFYFQVGYRDYNYDITTQDVDIILNTFYSATGMEIVNANRDILNNSTIDVFSSYEIGDGFQITGTVLPDDVALDDSSFYISVDLNQEALRTLQLDGDNPISSFVTFYYRGQVLTFSNQTGSSIYVSQPILDGSTLSVASGTEFDIVEGVEFHFVPTSNANADTTLLMNFYRISEDDILTVTDENDEDISQITYLSSSATAPREVTYTLKISGLSTISGLELEHDSNSRFTFSDLTLLGSTVSEDEGMFIIVRFTVTLNGSNFDSVTNFWFEHITGKTSEQFTIHAFVPITSASISNADKSSADVYRDEQSVQDYVNFGGMIQHDVARQSQSLSRLMLEAGVSLPLYTDYANATLAENGIAYSILSLDNLVNAVMIVEGVDEETAQARAEEIFASNSLDGIATNYYIYFEENDGLFVNINQDRLSLTDNEFRGYICVSFNGYDENHEEVVLVRFFALESFYSVRYLSPNVQTSLLYTTETLSENDMGRSRVDVAISMRPDEKVPTYSNSLSSFEFSSALEEFEITDGGTHLQNRYYEISNISFANSGRYFRFRIIANSTNLQTSVRDILTITYHDGNGVERRTEIQIEIRNVNRVESVQWLNRTEDNEIYLNLTTTVSSERSFTISTSVMPSDANDIGLTYRYFANAGSTSDLSITTSSIGQTFNLNINTSTGGYGSLYLLPNDMVKTVDGVPQVLLYRYTEDAGGNIIETPIYKRLSEFDQYYDLLLNENDEISTYFYNNDGEQIFYKDLIIKISITIADGLSEGTAIRVYNEADLQNIDTAKFYRIMNNIALTNWTSYREFSGMFFAREGDSVTLTFAGNSQNFVDTLLANGTIKNLNFVGNVTSSGTEAGGFVVNTNFGTIDDVAVDVYYSNGQYLSSNLTAYTSYVGALAGINYGTIANSASYGVSITSTNAVYVGGIVGNNQSRVENCGVEFYNFVDESGRTQTNSITTNAPIGGIVGFGGQNSVIDGSYAYAYSLMDSDNANVNTIFRNDTAIKAAFLASFEVGARVNESFAFLGNLLTPVESNNSTQRITFINSYISYYQAGASGYEINTRIFVNASFAYADQRYQSDDLTQISDNNVLTTADIPSDYSSPDAGSKWANLVVRLDTGIWQTVDIDREVNFGFMHLQNHAQSAAVDVAGVEIADNVSPLKSLSAGNGKGILFVYTPNANITDSAELSALQNYNTVTIAELFGVSEEQARSLLVTSESRNISISTSSIRILSRNATGFTLDVHSRMDYTSYKTFTFVVLNYLPELSTTINGNPLTDGQTVLLQTGLNNSRTVMFNTNNTIYLNGNGYSTQRDNISVEYVLTGNDYSEDVDGQVTSGTYLTVSQSNNSLTFVGNKNHEDDSSTRVESYLVVDDIAYDADLSGAIRANRTRQFGISVYNGATALAVTNATNLVVRPSQYAVFNANLVTDAENDNLQFALRYGEIEIAGESTGEYSSQFVVDSRLTLDLAWTKTQTADGYDFRIWVGVAQESKHLVEHDYENLQIVISPTSQVSNDNYQRVVGISVRTQEIDSVGIATYLVESRQIRNSVLYLLPEDEITNTLTPSSDAIVAVTVDPAYALMTHFTLTYSVSGGENVGTVSLSRLAYNSRYGYYVNADSTSLIENGIRVNLTETDRTGNGVYYFRIYISSAFESNSNLQLTLTYYNGDTVLVSGTHNLNIDYMANANIRVDGASTIVLAKGGSAQVTVTVDIDQDLYDLRLQNNMANINLSPTTVQIFDTYKVYTATLTAYVDAMLTGGNDSGIFYVVASVRRVINNTAEIKESRATICLVDFSVDGDGIRVSASGGTATYNGQTYDVLYSYIGATDTLTFDYPYDPETYNYDPNDESEVSAVNAIMESRTRFERNNTYRDDETGYYINYGFNESTGAYEEIELKRQLWYATGEDEISSICNDSAIIQNDIFSIDEAEGRMPDGSAYTYLTITGRRTGRQLMMLRTTIIYQGIEMYYDYYFLVVVDIYSDEEMPTQIYTADEFVNYATNSEQADDYILMNDIVLTNYTPLDTTLFNSLDGNGYTIHINSFAYPEDSTLNLALFNTVTENTTLKNVRVNIYNGGQISVNISNYRTINIAGFAITNNGIIYNCEVLSYFDDAYQSSSISGDTGLVVTYTMGANTDPIEMTASMVSSMNISSTVSGFVYENNASITNSRVGGDSIRQIVNIAGTDYLRSRTLGLFVIKGQGEVSGFVNQNGGEGYVSASFAKNIQIYNDMQSTTSLSAGFVIYNLNNIQNSYVEGLGEDTVNGQIVIYNTLSNIKSLGIIAGFVYENDALIKNSYANIAIENSESRPSMAAGFVYINNSSGTVTLCYAACQITQTDVSQMQFSGVDELSNSLNQGSISLSYFYNESLLDDTNQTAMTSGALAVTNVNDQDTFYGFSFSSGEDAYDGIWSVSDTQKLTLVSPNQIAFSNRYAVTNGTLTSVLYRRSITDAETMRSVDLSYGSDTNPIIIRDAYDFAMATGDAGANALSSYREYYNDTEVFGNYRLVNNIDMSEIDQNAENDDSIKLTTTAKTLSGLLDGNGFTISNISLGSSVAVENYGLFAKMHGAVVMNLDLVVDSIHNSRANIVGTLAGTAVDSRILAISLSPVSSQDMGRTSIQGNNVVGGVVGMLFGESQLSDINVVDIDVYSAYYQRGKQVGTNSNFVGINMRSSASTGNSLASYVSRLSYAGAITGYVDIYDTIYSGAVTFSSSLEMSDYNIVTVHVSDAVNIYGEVAGGLFGYVGISTLIYDATIALNADMSLTNPSYIISKNLFAGGLIGENYGGLFAVSASYEQSLQDTIEKGLNGDANNEYNYYNGSVNVERGQQSIFSYTPNDEGYNININDPLFVGGLVGYMGGGYIYIGYNKLNVISHSDSTFAVGGIIGLAGYTESVYDINFADPAPQVNILLNDVYASGDVYVDGANGTSAGIVGALETVSAGSDRHTSALAMKNVLAVNYYSYNGSMLTGDRVATGVENYISDRHFMLVGGIYNANLTGSDLYETQVLNGDLYLIDSENNYVNILSSGIFNMHQALTVGGYTNVQLGTSGVSLGLKPYGFDVTWHTSTDTDGLYDAILSVESIGSSYMTTLSSAYARLYTYFIPNGWNDEYWEHAEDDLFPHIELLPTLNIMFWDVYNTSEVLSAMQNGNITVVLRGRVSEESESGYRDIDLREYGDASGIIENFSGELISYYDYINSSTEGFVTQEITTQNGTIIGGHRSTLTTSADKVGIIINKSLFDGIGLGANIRGINFYLCPDDMTEDGSLTGDVSYNLISGNANQVLFDDVNIVLNCSLNIETQGVAGVGFAAGLISNVSYASSYINTRITMRYNSVITFVHNKPLDDEFEEENVYVGILAGYIAQNTSFTQLNIQGISFVNEDGDNSNVTIDINSDGVENLYAGLYAGMITKSNVSGRIALGLSNVGNVNMSFSTAENSNTSVHIGGFAGEIHSVDSVSLVSSGDSDIQESFLNINQTSNVNMLYAGLAFGSIVSCPLNIANVGYGALSLNGGIYQVGDSTSEVAYLGGIAGYTNSSTTISGFSVNFNVGSKESASDDANNYLTNPNDSTATLFDKNLYDYSTGFGSAKLTPFKTKGTSDANIAGDSIGGFFGYVSDTLSITRGTCTISGNIDVEVQTSETEDTTTLQEISIGGLVGQTISSIMLATEVENTLNISVGQSTMDNNTSVSAYVGGVVGKLENVSQENASSSQIGDSTNIDHFSYTGNLLASVDKLYFGGAVGYIARQDFADSSKEIAISGIIYGGAVKIYGKVGYENNAISSYVLPKEVSVGGVVGSYNIGPDASVPGENVERSYTISNCIAYGDVFVNYLLDSSHNERLASYNFGGIVGVGAPISVSNCYSLMTSFNDRLTNDLAGGSQNSFTNAIVGRNSDSVVYSENYYNSGVVMAYQEEGGNIDAMYGDAEEYSGYTTVADRTEVEGEDLGLSTNTNILSAIINAIGTSEFEIGHKLNPFLWSSGNTQIVENEDNVDSHVKIDGSLHGIKWVSMTTDISTSESIAETLTNYAFIGNGHTFTRTINGDVNGSFGGIVDNLGSFVAEGQLINNKSLNFNIISGLVAELDITGNDVVVESDKARDIVDVGGVAGSVAGHSFIYGVGVKGTFSVGGYYVNADNKAQNGIQLNMGGIAGHMQTGVIAESYVDANITYRAGEPGILSGVANMADWNTLIKSTYSSGRLETYVNIDIYTFANSSNTANRTTADLLDCYSISQVKKNNALGEDIGGLVKFINVLSSEDANITGTTPIKNVISGSNEVLDSPYGTTIFDIEELSVPYYGITIDGVIENGIKQYSLLFSGGTEDTITEHAWYFNRYVNYGYASHGFGYLKNVTTYLVDDSDDAQQTNNTDLTQYQTLKYEDVIEGGDTYGNGADWYLGVLNQGKFNQMLATVETDGDNYNQNYKFVLRYDFTIDQIGGNIGENGADLIIDGNGNTLNVEADEDGNIGNAVFGEVVGTIKNLHLSDINIIRSNARAGNYGVLANTVNGTIDNISVNGSITITGSSNINVGGVVGYLNGRAYGIESVVQVYVSAPGSVGGVVGFLETTAETVTARANSGGIVGGGGATEDPTVPPTEIYLPGIYSSSNNGQIIVESSGSSSGIVNLTLPAKIDTEDSSTQNISVPIVVGGIVGRVDANVATGISNTYNANAVLGNYTNNSSRHSLVGGIVGYAIGRGVNLFTIIDSYNAGLVGAGNTAGGIAVAGGIIGYGNDVTIEGCVNDAQVEAVSESPDGSSDVSASLISGVESTGNYMAEPRDLEYYVTLTYNQGKNRQVYAYGLGYLSSGSMTGSATSTNNIKNSGSLGEIIQRETLIFDRAAILDNVDGSTDYRGKFSALGTIYANGYDSFGYISRIYMIDTVTRGYFGGAQGDYVNEIEYATRQVIPDEHYLYENSFYIAKIDTTDSSMESTHSREYSIGNDSSLVKEEDYYMAATTAYYESLNFDRYDEFVAKENIVGVAGSSEVENYEDIESTEEAVNEGIENIDEGNEVEFQSFTINGTNAAVVYTAGNIKTVYGPFERTVDITGISISQWNIDTINLTNQSFSIGNIVIDGEEVKPQFYTASYDVNGDELSIHFDLFFAEDVSGDIQYTVNYTTTPIEVSLGLNNVVEEFGRTKIILEDDNNSIDLTQEIIDEINNDASDDSYYINTSVLVDGEPLSGYELYFDQTNGYAYIMCNESTDYFHDKTMSITIDHSITRSDTIIGGISTSTQEGTISFSQSAGTGQLTYVGYEASSLPDEFLTNRSDLTTEDGYVYGTEFTLNPAVVDSSRFAFGEEGQYHIRYENGTFFAEDLNEEDGILLSVENNTLRIVVSQTVDNVEVAIDPSTISQSFETEINTFYNEVIGRFSMTIEPRTIYTQDGNILMEGQDNIATDFDDLNLLMYFTPVMNGNFNPFDDSYNNSNGDFSSEVENGSGIESGETTMFGMTFYMPTVTFNYVIERGSLQYGGEEGVGYELTLLDSASQAVGMTQGFWKNNDSFALTSGMIAVADAINVRLIKTSLYTDNLQDDAFDLSLNSSVFSFEYIGPQYDHQYTVSNGVETCPIHNGEDVTDEEYISTQGVFSDVGTQYTYNYKIYECGAISVEYVLSDISTLNYDKWQASARYVTDIDMMLRGKMITYSPTMSSVEINGETQDVLQWNSLGESELDLNVFNAFDPSNDYALYGQDFEVIDVNTIATYFADEILFARVPWEDGYQTDGLLLSYSYFEEETIVNDELNLYSNNISSFDVAQHVDDKEIIAGSVLYRVQGEGVYRQPANGTIINANSYTPETFEYIYQTFFSGTAEMTVVGDDNGKTIFEYVILANNINIGQSTLGDNEKVIIGNHYNLKYIGNSPIFDSSNNRDIKNLNLIGIISAYNIPNDLAIIADSNNANIIDVNVFGTIRNVSGQLNNSSTVESVDEIKVFSTFVNTITTNVNIDITSYVTMTEIDSMSMPTLVNDLTARSDIISYNSHDIMIAGDGLNGSDGLNGNDVINSKSGDYGRKGTDGGDGGNIIINTETIPFEGYYRPGNAGIGGNGGNGENGKFDFEKLKAIAGGDGGQAGASGSLGTMTKDGTRPTDIDNHRINIIERNGTPLGGNGGLGAFGRVNYNNKYYTSGASGDRAICGEIGDNSSYRSNSSGKSGTWKYEKSFASHDVEGIGNENSSEEVVGFGGMASGNFTQSNENYFGGNTGAWGGTGSYDSVMTRYKGLLDAGVDGIDYSNIKSSGDDSLKPQTVYIVIQTQTYFHWWLINWEWYFCHGYRVAWTSGEGINSVNACGYTGTLIG